MIEEVAPTPISPAQRAQALCDRRRERGEPMPATFDRALRRVVFRQILAGETAIELPALMRDTVAALVADKGTPSVVASVPSAASSTEAGSDRRTRRLHRT